MKKIWFCLNVFFIVACSENSSNDNDVLKLAVLPDQNEVQLRNEYQPLVDYFNDHDGIKAELLIPSSYNELLQWFDNKKIDIALFGGVTYIQAHLKNKAVPLVMRDVDGRFRSVALVRVNSPAKSIRELAGSTLAFGSWLSTSGHFMPRHFLNQEKIVPESFFTKVEYSGAHDLTAKWVQDGRVDVGISNSGIVNEMFRDGRLRRDKVKVIWQTPAFSDYVWAVQESMSREKVLKIRNVFLNMNHNREGEKLLQRLGANYYIPILHSDFISLEEVVLEMSNTEKQ